MRQIDETRGGVLTVAPRFNGPPGEPTVAPRPAPSLAAARHATRRYAAADPDRHIFPTCVVCGPLRPDDGLHVFPGPLSAGDVLACPWTPAPGLGGQGGRIDSRLVWAALDCPSGFACMPEGRVSVLAAMTARIDAPVRAGETYVIAAWPRERGERKHRGASAVYAADGTPLAVAEALWITLEGDRGARWQA